MRRLAVLVFFLCAINPLTAQEQSNKYSLLGCSTGAVDLDIDKNPPLHFVALKQVPEPLEFDTPHRFIFRGPGPFLFVDIYLTASLPENPVGRASEAKLHIYAGTAQSADDYHAGKLQWWRLDSTGAEAQREETSGAASLKFDAKRIGNCFGQGEDCSFAEVGAATSDPDKPLVAIKFGQDLGGANANNWTEDSLLLDFRTSPPGVLVTLECGYNEGGGACTALDSAEMARSELRCGWERDSEDFLCSENSEPDGEGHRDFYLLSDRPGPPRSDEVGSLQDAVKQFRAKGTEAAVKVQGIGPVRWIDEIQPKSGSKVIVLGSAELFHFIPETSTGLLTPVHVKPHPVIEGPPPFSNPPIKIDNAGWTRGGAITFRSRQIYQDKDLTVLQVVSSPLPNSRELYWLGVAAQAAANSYDAIQLVGGAHYGSCGNSITPENVVSIGSIQKPFSVPVRIEPATGSSENEDSPISWAYNDADQKVSECIRPGQITWKQGKFTGSMEDHGCAAAEEPKYIQVDETGTINVSDKPVH